MGPEEFAEKYREDFEKNNRGFQGNGKNKRKRTEKIRTTEDIDLNAHFMKTYKSIARKIHPDLEQDSEIRRQKEKLMQELTNAKDNRDLFMLLSIKLKVEMIENREITIDENHLKIYAEKLLEKKKELEQDIFVLKHHSGWNSWLYQNFYALHTSTTIKHMDNYKTGLEEETEQGLELGKAAQTVTGMKKYIREINPYEDDNIFDAMEFFF